jgi:hypothetical protein
MNPIKKRPWLLIVVAFLILIAGWTAFINLAVKNQPATVPLESESSSQRSEATP